jgi:hypothetical protein
MRPHPTAFRSVVLLVPLALAAAGFARGGQQTPCPSVLASHACQVNGFHAYFSAAATGSVLADSITLADGAVYLAPLYPDRRSTSRRVLATAAGPGVVVYTTASGPSQAELDIHVPRRIPTRDTSARLLVSYRTSGVETTVLVALVGGRLAALPTLRPGCEMILSVDGGSAATPIADDPATSAMLAAFRTQFGVVIPAPKPGRC